MKKINNVIIKVNKIKNIIKIFSTKLNENSSYYFDAAKIVNFGWKKEAIPITQNKQSLITRIFKSFFG